MFHETFKHLEDIFLIYKRHFTVYLSELRLTVGTEVFVTETFYYLEITVETADHKELLEGLRRLGECIELTGVHA